MEDKIDNITLEISQILNDSGAYKKIDQILKEYDTGIDVEFFAHELEDIMKNILEENIYEVDEDTLKEMADDINFERSRGN
tara:strand:- start:236 stop:478 length:243 start_codon:yes stop_codon:yes gene_type:complete